MGRSWRLAELEAHVPAVAALGPELSRARDKRLRAATAELRSRATAGEPAVSLLPEAFALVREAARRSLGRDVHDTQVVAGAAMQAGMLAVTLVGPGRSLTVTLPAYLHALSGEGVHVVTAGDDLARSDAEEVGAVLRFLGLRVGVVGPGIDRSARVDAYAADVTYGSYTELGYDLLRDNMVTSRGDVVRRSSSVALVDQADVVLVDEGRAPLIVSGTPKDGPRETLARVTVRGYLRTYARLGALAHAPKALGRRRDRAALGLRAGRRAGHDRGRDPLDGRRPGRVSLRQSMALDHDEIDDGATLRFHALRREILNADGDAARPPDARPDALDRHRRERPLVRPRQRRVRSRCRRSRRGVGRALPGAARPRPDRAVGHRSCDPGGGGGGARDACLRGAVRLADPLGGDPGAQQVMVRCLDQVMRRYYALRAEWKWPFASTDRSVWPAALDAHRRDDDEWSAVTLASFRRDTVRYFLRVEVTVKG